MHAIVAATIEADPTAHSLLIIGTYRSNEIDDTHFLPSAIDIIRQHEVPHQDIYIAQLSRQAISDMVRDTVRVSSIKDDFDMEALIECIYSKTEGNAFFAAHVSVSPNSVIYG